MRVLQVLCLEICFLKAKKDGFDFQDAIQEIANSSTKADTSLKFFDARATTVAVTLAKNISKVDELTKSYENSGGAAADMAAIMDATLEGSLFKLKSAAEGLAISFWGRYLSPTHKKDV